MCLIDAGLMNLTTILHSEIKKKAKKKASVCVYIDVYICMCVYVYIHMCVCIIIILAKILASPHTREVHRAPRQVSPSAGVVKFSLELDSVEFKSKQLNLHISIQKLSHFSFQQTFFFM